MNRQKFTKPLTISAIKLYQDNDELIIPKVQRDLVWTLSQKQLLIDSLIKDYDIPKLYFRQIDDDGKKYEVIDGQQRIHAILDFIQGDYSLPADADPYNDEDVSNKKWSELSTDLQIIILGRALDVVILQGYNDEETDETFLRLQNGTPLKAPEKRRAIQGNMRNVVEALSKNTIYKYCAFENTHYAYEDVAAKSLKLLMAGGPTSIGALSLSKMYEQNKTITIDDPKPKEESRAFNFLYRAFKHTSNPHLKKYAVVDLTVIVSSLLNIYDLNNYAEEFGNVYLKFQDERAINAEKPEGDQDPRLVAYGNTARGDSLEYLEFRQNLLREYILEKMPYLTLKDNNRNFTADQRAVIYRLSNGKCQICGKECTEEEFEADHIIPWSKGGRTQIANGQVLCSTCNEKKSDSLNEIAD